MHAYLVAFSKIEIINIYNIYIINFQKDSKFFSRASFRLSAVNTASAILYIYTLTVYTEKNPVSAGKSLSS